MSATAWPPKWFLDEHPASPKVIALLERGKTDEALDQWWIELCAAAMRITEVEYRRRYMHDRRQNRTAGRLVYFIAASRKPRNGQPIKIGMSVDPPKRVREISLASGKTMHLLGAFPGGRELEAALHHRFKPDRIKGEWFRMSPDLRDVIAEAA